MAGTLRELNDQDFVETISQGLTLVDFHATWCGPCRMIAPIVEQLASMFNGQVRVVKVDIDQAQNTSMNLQITSVPTVILFKDGKELKRVVGVRDLEYFSNLIKSNL